MRHTSKHQNDTSCGILILVVLYGADDWTMWTKAIYNIIQSRFTTMKTGCVGCTWKTNGQSSVMIWLILSKFSNVSSSLNIYYYSDESGPSVKILKNIHKVLNLPLYTSKKDSYSSKSDQILQVSWPVRKTFITDISDMAILVDWLELKLGTTMLTQDLYHLLPQCHAPGYILRISWMQNLLLELLLF